MKHLISVLKCYYCQIKRQQVGADIDDAIDNYDYENINDRENYCPNDEVSTVKFLNF